MLLVLILVLLIIALCGGLAVHPLLFLVAIVAIALFLGPYSRGRVP